MTVFYQHVGIEGIHDHLPLSVGTPRAGLKQFRFEDIESDLTELSEAQVTSFRNQLRASSEDIFQIWGIPSGATRVIRELVPGDYFLLLETVGPGGTFAYGGRVLARAPKECFVLSTKIWGEPRYPIIILLRGSFTSYSWYDFCDALHYKRSLNPRGQTSGIPTERLLSSTYQDEATLIFRVLGHDLDIESRRPTEDAIFLDPSEPDLSEEEGRRVLRQHLHAERSYKLVKDFKQRLNDFRCTICSFDFEKVYGTLGKGFIECHHIKPVSEMAEGERTTLKDLVPVCSNCHRMLHRQLPMPTIEALKVRLAERFAANAQP